MKKLKKIIVYTLIFALILGLTPSTSIQAKKKPKLNKKKVVLVVGSKIKLKVLNNKKKVKWSSSNKTVAPVTKKGVVTAKKKGIATITAKIGKKKYKCKVTVNAKPAPTPAPQPPATEAPKPVTMYTVTFVTNGGSSVASQQIPAGGRVRETYPVRDGYYFEGWYTDPDFDNYYYFNSAVYSDLTLYALWEIDDYQDDPDTIDLGDIQDMSENGDINVHYNESGRVETIDGSFTDEKVTSVADAANLLNKSSGIIANSYYIEDADIEQVETTDGFIYRASPSYDGYDIIGGQTVLETAKDGTVTALINSYANNISDIDTWEDIDYDEALITAVNELFNRVPYLSEYYNNEGGEIDYDIVEKVMDDYDIDYKMVIYAQANERPYFSYQFDITNIYGDDENYDDSGITLDKTENLDSIDSVGVEASDDQTQVPYLHYTIYVAANSGKAGEVLFVDTHEQGESWNNITATCKDHRNVTRTFGAQESGSKIRLRDGVRNLTTYEATSALFQEDYYLLPGNLVQTDLLGRVDKEAVSAHANMSEVYDFYKDLGRNSYDGRGSTIKVSYNYKDDSFSYNNAFWTSSLKMMVFGNAGNYQDAVDVCGHEFTHAVIDTESHLIYSDESGALNESLADIMGALIEDKTGTNRWLLGEDSDEVVRSMQNPGAYDQPNHYSNYVNTTRDNGGVHTNSGIFNYAAYKMMTSSDCAGVTDKEWAQLFYKSIRSMTSTSTFLQARYVIELKAHQMNFSHSEIEAIGKAFDAAGITSKDNIRIVLRWGAEPYDIDSHLVGPTPDGYDRFHIYYSDMTVYNDNGLYAADLDYDDTSSYGPEITTIRTLTPGDYYFFVHDYTHGGDGYEDSSSYYDLSNSGAYVNIYRGDSLTPEKTYHIRSNRAGLDWNVCKITISDTGNVTYTELNTMSHSQLYN